MTHGARAPGSIYRLTSDDSVIEAAFAQMLLAAGRDDVPSRPARVDDMSGEVLDGRYLVTEPIASGAMGQVYKAVQNPLDRTVAIKFLKPGKSSQERFKKCFFLEACLCARLTHPNTVRIFDYGNHGEDRYYIVMEYLQGQTLERLVDSVGVVDPLRAIRIAKQVCSALGEAHEQDLVHRDIKLSNLFLTSHGLEEDFV